MIQIFCQWKGDEDRRTLEGMRTIMKQYLTEDPRPNRHENLNMGACGSINLGVSQVEPFIRN